LITLAAVVIFAAPAGYNAFGGPIALAGKTTLASDQIPMDGSPSGGPRDGDDGGLQQDPVIRTDLPEYYVGEFVNVSGLQWAADDVIEVAVDTPVQPEYAITDGDGNFGDVKFAVLPEYEGLELTFTANSLGKGPRTPAETKAVVAACGNAVISSVVVKNGSTGCVNETPSGPNHFWDVGSGGTYTVTLSGLTEYTNNGYSNPIQVIVQSSDLGNYCVRNVAGSGGVYTFDYPAPANGCNTVVISYKDTMDCSPAHSKKAKSKLGKCPGHLRFKNSTCTGSLETDCGRGACCYGATCQEEVKYFDCLAAGGQYQGDGWPCLPNSCWVPQPCTLSVPPDDDLGCNPLASAYACVPPEEWATTPEQCADPDFAGKPCVLHGLAGTNHCEVSATSRNGCLHSVTNHYYATGENGNTCFDDQTLTWTVDTTGPEINPRDNATEECDGLGNLADFAAWKTGATASDECGHASDPLYVEESDSLNYDPPEICPRVITAHWESTDDCGNTTVSESRTFTIEDTTPPTFDNCPGSDPSPSCHPLPYEPSGCDDAVTASDTCGEATVSCDFEDSASAGVHTRTLTYTASDGCNTSTCVQHITWTERHCSLTQGAYGNTGGSYLYQGEAHTTEQLLAHLLSPNPPSWTATLRVGVNGQSLTFLPGDVACEIARLPGTSSGNNPLPGNFGDKTCDQIPSSFLDKQGRIKSTFVGQTIVLSLNVRYDTTLGSFDISQPFCIQGVVLPVTISPTVLAALDNVPLPRTVDGLLALANLSVGGVLTTPAVGSDINVAVSAINQAFDKCQCIGACQ
jgi:hypothetical protein